MERTDLKKVKETAVKFLHTPLERIDFTSYDANHPIFRSCIIAETVDGYEKTTSLLADTERYAEIVQMWEGKIAEKTDAMSVLQIMRPDYQLDFFEAITPYLSVEDLSKLLAHAWKINRLQSQNAQNTELIVKWFQTADKALLMDEDERAYLDSLSDDITVYQSIAPKTNPNSFSWTANLEYAKQEATKRGKVLTGTVKKDHVLAYFRRGNELVICPENVLNVTKL